ncbi:MAG TPA: aminopeptidase [Solirubrobacteraceae bacterium]|nr:aminopeptidase [Solirubrobacteraceae bacterium]
MSYQPPQQYLERYADLLVNFALGGGSGIHAGDVVSVSGPESAKPLYAEVCRAVWRAGGHVLARYAPDDDARYNLSREFFEIAGEDQLSFFAEHYWKGLIDQADHLVAIRCQADPHALRDVDPARILAQRRAMHPAVQWQAAKESAGKLTWTLASYGTEAMAREAGLSLEEYWEQIIRACFLDEEDPKRAWAEIQGKLDEITGHLNSLPIDRLHVQGEDADLWITVGEERCWVGGSGRNIPSFEVFTSPDWRGTEGWIRFSEPLYVHGSLLTGIELEFRDGRVSAASAKQNEQLLKEMLSTTNADRLGEFSLTDSRLSRITRFMADTLYDENVGGPFGNTHLALGRSIENCYAGDATALTDADWERLGLNQAATHTDIVSTTDRKVTAVLRDGSEQVIYESGRFTFG